jgi:hypothetical protein
MASSFSRILSVCRSNGSYLFHTFFSTIDGMEIIRHRIGPLELIGIAGAMALMSCLASPVVTAETAPSPLNESQPRTTIETYIPEQLRVPIDIETSERHH